MCKGEKTSVNKKLEHAHMRSLSTANAWFKGWMTGLVSRLCCAVLLSVGICQPGARVEFEQEGFEDGLAG